MSKTDTDWYNFLRLRLFACIEGKHLFLSLIVVLTTSIVLRSGCSPAEILDNW